MRYGYNWFVRGTDSNPDNHGFDLDEPWISRGLQLRDSRRHPAVPALRHLRISGHGHRRRRAAERDPFVHGHAEQDVGRALDEGRPRVSPVSRARQVLRQQPDGAVQFHLGLDSRPAGQLRRGSRRRARPVVRFLPPRHSELGIRRPGGRPTTRRPRRGASSCRTTGESVRASPLNLGLRYELEAPLTEVDNRSVRGFDATAAQPIEAAARARYALNPTPEVPASQFNVRGGLTFPGVGRRAARAVCDAEEQLHAATRPGLQAGRQDLAAGRLRRVLRLPRPAPRGRDSERVQSDHEPRAEPRQRPDLHRDAVQSFPGRHPGAGRRGARARRRSWARASRSSIPVRSRRGCSAGRWASSASCRDAGSPRSPT